MNKLCLVSAWFCLFAVIQTVAQPSQTDSTSLQQAISSAKQFYLQKTQHQLQLYNGVEYITGTEGYVKGHPYFQSDVVEEGTISYDKIIYAQVPLQYDIFKDEVVVEHMGNGQKIKLHSHKIHHFSLNGHTFVRIQADSLASSAIRPGFYDRLYAGHVALYARRVKIAQQATRSVSKEYLQKNSYFIEKDTQYYPVKNKQSVLRVFKEQKKALQQFLRENHIKFKQDPEYAMAKLAEQYSQLVKPL
jgi:hypothetical protein